MEKGNDYSACYHGDTESKERGRPPPLIWGNTRKRRTKDKEVRNRESTMMFGNLQEVNSPIKTTIN